MVQIDAMLVVVCVFLLYAGMAIFAYAAVRLAARADKRFAVPRKARKPRTPKAIDTGRRDDEI